MKEIEESIKDSGETKETGDLVQDVCIYLMKHHYPPLCTEPKSERSTADTINFNARPETNEIIVSNTGSIRSSWIYVWSAALNFNHHVHNTTPEGYFWVTDGLTGLSLIANGI